MLELKLNGQGPQIARRWLDEEVGNAVAGLLPLATGRGKQADAVLEYLRETKRRGHAAVIEEQMANVAAEVADKVRRDVLERSERVYTPFDDQTTPAWLKSAAKEVLGERPTKAPDWARPTNLPALRVGDHCLNETQLQAVLAALRKSTFDTPWPLLTLLKEHVERPVLDAFAWRLFELWQAEGAPAKEKWALSAVGFLGGDACALALAPFIRTWPGQSQNQRAVLGLQCLRAIGSDTALMQLSTIAEKVRFQGVKKKATEFMGLIATDRGLSRAQLEDRIVPTLDLDARGSRVFDFGPRQFRFVLGPDRKPMVRDEAGKLKPNLPKPGVKDDREKSAGAVQAWNLLKKQVREVVKAQAHRLEQAMTCGRRWSVQDFETWLVRHPLMINLVRLVLWAGYDGEGELVRAFRVTEEREYVDAEDASCTLEGVASIGVAHPLHLTEEQRSRWGEVFSDYEIIPPFPQLGRRVHTLEAGERENTEITRFRGKKVPQMIWWGILKAHGWTEGPYHGGGFACHCKYYPGFDTLAVVQSDSASMESRQIRSAFFLWGPNGDQNVLDPHRGMPLKDVDPVVVSEVLGTLTVLASKAGQP
jgi:hypothetical protein